MAEIAITPIEDCRIASLAVRCGAAPQLTESVQADWGVALPVTPKRVAQGGAAFIWAGPSRWLVTATAADDLASVLRDRLALWAAVTDQTDGRALFRVGGPAARVCLAKLLPIDLHPRIFMPDDTALTVAARINLQIWQCGEGFELCVFRSYADHFHHLLRHAARSI